MIAMLTATTTIPTMVVTWIVSPRNMTPISTAIAGSIHAYNEENVAPRLAINQNSNKLASAEANMPRRIVYAIPSNDGLSVNG